MYPKPKEEIYNPSANLGQLLIKSYLRFSGKYNDDPKIAFLKYFRQEIQHTTYAMAKMNVFAYEMRANIALKNTMENPAFLNSDGSLKKVQYSSCKYNVGSKI